MPSPQSPTLVKTAARLLALTALALPLLPLAHAGSFGGPAPFRNGSPLSSGMDGRYSAVAKGDKGSGIAGIVNFEIKNNTQTNNPLYNRWVMFVANQTVQGSTAVAVEGSDITGILDSAASAAAPTDAKGGIKIPTAWQIKTNGANGYFEGKLNKRTFIFNGEGRLVGSPARTDLIVIVQQSDTLPVVTANAPIPASSFNGSFSFRLRGSQMTPIATDIEATQ